MATIKGTVTLTAPDGDGAGVYLMVLDINALCDAEEEFPDIMQGVVDIGSFRKIRRLVQIGLSRHHPDLGDQRVGEIIQSVGIVQTAEKITEALKATFPEAKPEGKLKARANAGTGTGR